MGLGVYHKCILLGCTEVESVFSKTPGELPAQHSLPSTAWLTSFTISRQLSRESESSEEGFYVASWRRAGTTECIEHIYPLTARGSLAGHTLSLLLHLTSFMLPPPKLGALKQKRPDGPRQDTCHHCLCSWDKLLNLLKT